MIGLTLLATCLTPSLQAKDITMDKSPDGNFALRIHLPKEAGDQPKVGMINLLTEEAVLELDCHRCYEGNAKPRLLWFSDSQRVAYYTPHPDGGYTQVYLSKRSRPLVNRFDGSNQGRSFFIRNRKRSFLAARPRK